MHFSSHNIFTVLLKFLSAEQNTRIIFHTLEANFAICLLGNIIHLARLEEDDCLKTLIFPNFVVSKRFHFKCFSLL